MLKPGFLPFGPPESRDGGECFAPFFRHTSVCLLICCAAGYARKLEQFSEFLTGRLMKIGEC